MPIDRIVFEKGLQVGNVKNSIQTQGTSVQEIVEEISQRYGVRPIVKVETFNFANDYSPQTIDAFAPDGRWSLRLKLSDLKLPDGMSSNRYEFFSQNKTDIDYIAGATVYHLMELSLAYAAACEHGSEVNRLFSSANGNSMKAFSFQNQPEAYYEFEALITASRRTYDALRYPLWKAFGGGKGTPRNFANALSGCTKLPDQLRDRLNQSWENYGEKLTDYRDCVQHYVPVSYPLQTAIFREVESGIWSVQFLIPDNPQERSLGEFKFENQTDALTYGWEVVNEVLNVAVEVFAAIPRE